MTRRSLRWDSPTTAAVAGGLTLVLLVVDLVLSFAEHNFTSSVDGALYAIMMAFAAVGLVVARQQPRNPIGWLLLGVALFEGIYCFAALYVAIDYGSHHGSLPFGLAAIWGQNSFWDLGIIIGLPALLLFPDGRLTSSRWVWALRAYAAIGVIVLASQCFTSSLLVSWVSSHQTHITGEGQFIGHPRVDAIVNFLASGLLVLALVPFWLSWVVLQMRAFRRSSGGSDNSSNGSARAPPSWSLAWFSTSCSARTRRQRREAPSGCMPSSPFRSPWGSASSSTGCTTSTA